MEFIVDIGLQRLVRGISDSSAADTQTFYRGDQHSIDLALLDNGIPIDPSTATVKLGLGLGLDTLPPEGIFRLSFASAQTPGFSYTGSSFPSAAAVSTALNALASITTAGGVTVTEAKPGVYRVDFNTAGARAEFQASGSFLPSGVILVNRLRMGDANYPEVQQIQLSAGPFALASGFVQSNPVATFTQGLPGVYTLKLPPTTLDAVISWGGSILARNGASSGQMQSALASANIIAQATALDGRTWIILGTAVPAPTITLRAAPLLTAALALDAPALVAALGSQASLAARLEIEVSRPGTRITAVQTPISISRTVLEDPTIPAGANAGVFMLRAVYDSDADGIISEAAGVRGPAGVISGAAIASGLSSIAAVQTTAGSNTTAITSLTGRVTTVETTAASNTTAATALTARVTSVETTAASNTAAIATTNTTLGTTNTSVTALTGRVTAVEATAASNTSAIGTTNTSVNTLNQRAPDPGAGTTTRVLSVAGWVEPATGGGGAAAAPSYFSRAVALSAKLHLKLDDTTAAAIDSIGATTNTIVTPSTAAVSGVVDAGVGRRIDSQPAQGRVQTNYMKPTVFSIAGWFRPDWVAGTAGSKFLFGHMSGGGSDNICFGIHVATSMANLHFHGNNFLTYSLAGRWTLGSWGHVVFTYGTGDTGTLYFDGELVATAVMYFGPTLPAAGFSAGGHSGAGAGGFEGRMDEISYFTTALNKLQVKSLYTAGLGSIASVSNI